MLYDPHTEQPPEIHIDRNGHVTTPEHQDAVGNILGKLGIAWAGFFAGISLSDLVLIATLIYTCIQTGVLIWEKIIKPWRRTAKYRKLGLTPPESKPIPLNSGD